MDDDLKAVVTRLEVASQGVWVATPPVLAADLRTLLDALRQRDEALISIRQQARLADDPEHHTLGLIDKIAEAALSKGATQ